MNKKSRRQRNPGPTGFGRTWRAATDGSGWTVEPYRTWCQRALELLPESRTVLVSSEQAEAMALLTPDDLTAVTPTLRIPFPVTLLDVHGAVIEGPSGRRPLDAVLLYEKDGALNGLTCARSAAGPIIVDMPPQALDGSAVVGLRAWADERGKSLTMPRDGVEVELDFHDPTMLAVESIAIGILAMLQSVNVELVESEPYPRAHRGEGLPRFEVVIRQTSRRGQRRDPRVDVEWSHRWEVRGHPKHFGEDTQLFARTERDHPEKILDHPERGPVVRLWCPAHVKGPEDKPLLPKIRRVA